VLARRLAAAIRRLLARCRRRCAGPVRRPAGRAPARGQPRRARPGGRQQLWRQRASNWRCCLLYELQARPADWEAFAARWPASTRACAPSGGAGGEALLRKKVNDMYAVLRDKVDADNYQAACGRPCSPNRMYAYRMLDTAYGEIARLFAAWREHRAQVGAILGRDARCGMPIEVRQLPRSPAAARMDTALERDAWSASARPGPLHTRSKRFDSLKNSPDKIGAMLPRSATTRAVSNRDRDWLQDRDTRAGWTRITGACSRSRTAPRPGRT
jgi:hypothetical protein